MPNTNEVLLILEGSQYSMSLDLNMGYYRIQLRKNASNPCRFVLPYGKYLYKHLTMGVANSPEIFKQKMNYLFNGFEFICLYIYKLLVLKKRDWTEYVQKLELTLNKL